VVQNEFYPVDIILPWSMLTYHRGMNNRPVGGRSSETLSHPIDMIIIIIINAIEQSFREANSAFRLLRTPKVHYRVHNSLLLHIFHNIPDASL
jgi:hypothetical protein